MYLGYKEKSKGMYFAVFCILLLLLLKPITDFDFATHTATANMLIYFRFVVDACSELNLRQANCLSSIFYLKFRFDTQFVFL